MRVTVQQVIELLTAPVGMLEQTVDGLLVGDPAAQVSGIVTAFMPSRHVLEQAVQRGANLVIVHEGLFYAHHDRDELVGDPIVQEKRVWVEASGLAIYRIHDYIHRYQPDGIMAGLLRELEWEDYVQEYHYAHAIVACPALRLRELAELVKRRLGIPYVRVAGDLEMLCAKVGVLVGNRGGGATAIPVLARADIDVVLYGEGPEWETPEYVRDATQQGGAKGLIVLGHAESEAPGMALLADRLREHYPDLPVRHVREQSALTILNDTNS